MEVRLYNTIMQSIFDWSRTQLVSLKQTVDANELYDLQKIVGKKRRNRVRLFCNGDVQNK